MGEEKSAEDIELPEEQAEKVTGGAKSRADDGPPPVGDSRKNN